jgi:hypothetical protein
VRAVVATRLVERLTREAPPEKVKNLLTDALLLTGLRVRRDVAAGIFRGVRAMHESDTYLAIVDEGREKQVKEDLWGIGEEKFGPPSEAVKDQLGSITDLGRLNRMIRRTVKAASWQELLETP